MGTSSDGNKNEILNMNTSFADKLKGKRPDRKQAIIIDCTEKIPVIEYITEIAKILSKPEELTHVDHLSNNRLCFFFANKTVVDSIISQQNKIIVRNANVHMRRLISPAVRIIMTNVSPTIPDEIIQSALQDLNLKILSPIKELRFGIRDPAFAHLLSFKRQVYVAEDNKQNIPESILLTYEDIRYRIYLATDVTCYACKKTGHIAAKCPNRAIYEQSQQLTTQPENSELTDSTEIQNSIDLSQPGTSKNNQVFTQTEVPTTIINIQNNETETDKRTLEITPTDLNNITQSQQESKTKTQKRPADSLSSAESSESIDKICKQKDDPNSEKTPDEPLNVPTNKQKKRNNRSRSLSPATSTEEWLKPLEQTFKDNEFHLTPYQFQNFIENMSSNNDPVSLAKNFTHNPRELIHIMETLHAATTSRSAKQRLTRTITKLQYHINKADK